MFGRRFFGGRYFGPRYWGDGGSETPEPEAETVIRRLFAYGMGPMGKTTIHPHPRFSRKH